MSQQNLIAVSIPEADYAEVSAAIATLSAKLMPHLRALSPQDRSELPKMGDKTVAFVQKAYEYGQKHRDLVPSFLDLDAMGVDVRSVQKLRDLAQAVNPIADALNDSIMLAGSDAYQGALVFYGNVKNAAKAKAPNAITVYEDLSARFPSRPAARKAN